MLIEGARVYPDGVVLRLTVRVREQPAELRRRVFQQLSVSHGRGMLHLALPPGGLRWGVDSPTVSGSPAWMTTHRTPIGRRRSCRPTGYRTGR